MNSVKRVRVNWQIASQQSPSAPLTLSRTVGQATTRLSGTQISPGHYNSTISPFFKALKASVLFSLLIAAHVFSCCLIKVRKTTEKAYGHTLIIASVICEECAICKCFNWMNCQKTQITVNIIAIHSTILRCWLICKVLMVSESQLYFRCLTVISTSQTE